MVMAFDVFRKKVCYPMPNERSKFMVVYPQAWINGGHCLD